MCEVGEELRRKRALRLYRWLELTKPKFSLIMPFRDISQPVRQRPDYSGAFSFPFREQDISNVDTTTMSRQLRIVRSSTPRTTNMYWPPGCTRSALAVYWQIDHATRPIIQWTARYPRLTGYELIAIVCTSRTLVSLGTLPILNRLHV